MTIREVKAQHSDCCPNLVKTMLRKTQGRRDKPDGYKLVR